MWSLEQALDLIRSGLQEKMHTIEHNISLTGSVLNKGVSNKDLDIVINPFYPDAWSPYEPFEKAKNILKEFNFKLVRNREEVSKGHDNYAEKADGNKWIEEWELNGKRVDIFFLK